MSWINLLGIAVGLAMDAFAVSITAGLTVKKVSPRHVFRVAFHFGLFQAVMPVLGWWAGASLDLFIAAYDHWVAMGILGFVGAKMIGDAFKSKEEQISLDPTRGWRLVALSIVISIDAFAVGLGLAFLGVSILLPSIVIGVIAAFFSAVGIIFGSGILKPFGKAAEIAGGVILMLIGVRIVVEHLA